MNKIYKLVWSKVRNCYVVVSELDKSKTKVSKSSVFNRTLVTGILFYILSFGFTLFANASGGQVISQNLDDFISTHNNVTQVCSNISGGGEMFVQMTYIGKNKTTGTIDTWVEIGNSGGAQGRTFVTSEAGSTYTAGTGISINSSNVISAKSASASAFGIAKLYTSTGSNTDGSMTQKSISDALDDKLSLSGGTLTGALAGTSANFSSYVSAARSTTKSSQPIVALKVTNITRNTDGTNSNVPASNVSAYPLVIQDNAGNAVSSVMKYTSTAGLTSTRLYDYDNQDGTAAYIGVGHTADGTAFTYAPTPASTSNDTNIATTAFVTTKHNNTITGLSVNGQTITYTKGDGTTGTITTQDNNTTYSNMTASELSTGTATTARSISAKVVSDYVKTKTDDKLTGLSVSGKTITYTKGDGTTGTITTQDTTYSAGTVANLTTGTDTTGKVWTSKVLADYVKDETHITADGQFAKKANTAAANITALDTATKNAIKGLSVSGTTITYTKGDGTTGTITTQDNNTTYSSMTASELSTGTATTSRTMTAKVVSDYVKTKTDDKLTGLSVSGKTITYTKGDGTTDTITTQDTTYSAGTATNLTTGTDTTNKVWTSKVLSDYVKGKTDDKITGLSVNGTTITYTKGDGTTGTITTQDNNTTYSAMTASELTTGTATTSRTMTAKVVSDFVKSKTDDKIAGLSVNGKTITYTKGDGTTGTITTQDTTYSKFTGATSSTAGTTGLVTAPAVGQQAYVLHGDGTWSADKDTTYTAMTASELTTGTATTARSITPKVLSDYVKDKTDDKISDLSLNGNTITYTKGNGTTGSFNLQDTTYTTGTASVLSTGTETAGKLWSGKVLSDYVKDKTDDKIANLSVNGNTITYTKGNGTTGTLDLQDTTYTNGTASVLNAGTETAGKLWSSKVLSDYVVGKVATETTNRSTADTALSNRIGTLSSNGYYIKKSATNDMATNMTLLDYQLKATNDNITGFATDITRNKNNIASLNTSVTAALGSVSAASSTIDLLSNSKADASLGNLNTSGKRVIKNAAIDAVQEYMAQYGNVATLSASAMYNNNSNTLSVTDAGNGSLHVGEGSYVNGTSSIAIGVGNQVNANNAGAFGDPSIINADASYVLGNDDTVNTGAVGSFVVGNDSVSSAKAGLTFGSNNMLESTADDSVALGNNVIVSGKNSVALGSNSTAVEDNVISVGNVTLQRKIVNVLGGEISEDSNEAVTGSQLFATNQKVQENTDAIAQKADLDATNINVESWSEKLGIGAIEDGNTGLVNGGTVFSVIQEIKDNNLIQQVGDTINIGGNTDGNTINVASNTGEGRVITGVITDPDNPYSATNVGYVQSVSENIVNAVNRSLEKVNNKVNKVGANAAALASLTPASFESDEKWSLAASFGHYEGETAGAVGAFYKPTENIMMNLRGSFAGGENMFGGGVAVSLSKGDIPGVTKRQLAMKVNSLEQGREQDRLQHEQDRNQIAKLTQHIVQQDEQIAELKALVQNLVNDKNVKK